MKLQDLVGDPVPLELGLSLENLPLPTTRDVFKHFSYHIDRANATDKGNWTYNMIYNRVAADLIMLYENRSLPTAAKSAVVRYDN